MTAANNYPEDIPVEEFFASYATGGTDPAAPYLRVNFVTSADGAATVRGRSGGLGGTNDRRLMNVLRAMSDAVLVGAGTVRAEGYGGLNLSEEVRPWRTAHYTSEAPQMVIAANRLALDPQMDVFQHEESPPIIAAPKAAVQAAGDRFDGLAEVLACGTDRLDLRRLLQILAERGQTQILCEGGPHLFGSLLELNLVDEVDLTVSPMFEAGTARRISVSDEELHRTFRIGSVLADQGSYLFLRYLVR